MIKYSNIKEDRVMRACTGLSFAKFESLSEAFEQAYKNKHGICYFEMLRNLNKINEVIFSNYSDILFFVLYCQKVGNTYDVLGVSFGTSGANVHHNLTKFRPILILALDQLGHLPLQEINSLEDMSKVAPSGNAIIDATEFPIEKPHNKVVRDKSNSVKKKILHKKNGHKRSY
jgi:hypothetical protein